MSANNHLLNTWMMMLQEKLFGNSEFALRLHNLPGHALYLFFSYKLLQHFRHFTLALCGFLMLNLNPFILDFFSLARGYGISLSLLLGALFFLKRYIETRRILLAQLSMLFCAIAMLAHMALLNVLLMIWMSLLIIQLAESFREGKAPRRQMIQLMISISAYSVIPLLALLYVIPVSAELKKVNAFFFGGDNGFWKDTFNSLLDRSMYGINYPIVTQRPLKVLVLAALAYMLWKSISGFFQKKVSLNDSFFAFGTFILLGCIALTILQHYIFNTKYLLDRTALMFIPLFVVPVFTVLDRYMLKAKRVMVFSSGATLLLLLHFSRCFNLHYVDEWKFDADKKHLAGFLESHKDKILKGKQQMTIGVNYIQSQTINFYRAQKHLYWLGLAEESGSYSRLHDLYYFPSHYAEWMNNSQTTLLPGSPLSQALLFRNDRQLTGTSVLYKYLADFESRQLFPNLSREEFSIGRGSAKLDKFNKFTDAVEICVDSSWINKNVLLQVNAMVYAKNPKADAELVVSIDRWGKNYHWKSINSKDMIRKKRRWMPLMLTLPLPDDIQPNDIIKVFLMNQSEHEIYMDNTDIEIRSYEFRKYRLAPLN